MLVANHSAGRDVHICNANDPAAVLGPHKWCDKCQFLLDGRDPTPTNPRPPGRETARTVRENRELDPIDELAMKQNL